MNKGLTAPSLTAPPQPLTAPPLPLPHPGEGEICFKRRHPASSRHRLFFLHRLFLHRLFTTYRVFLCIDFSRLSTTIAQWFLHRCIDFSRLARLSGWYYTQPRRGCTWLAPGKERSDVTWGLGPVVVRCNPASKRANMVGGRNR